MGIGQNGGPQIAVAIAEEFNAAKMVLLEILASFDEIKKLSLKFEKKHRRTALSWLSSIPLRS